MAIERKTEIIVYKGLSKLPFGDDRFLANYYKTLMIRILNELFPEQSAETGNIVIKSFSSGRGSWIQFLRYPCAGVGIVFCDGERRFAKLFSGLLLIASRASRRILVFTREDYQVVQDSYLQDLFFTLPFRLMKELIFKVLFLGVEIIVFLFLYCLPAASGDDK